jgi:hypothetical protein
MPASARRPLFALIVICSLACISRPARADSVGVNGTAYGGSDTNGLSLIAGVVSIFSAAPIGFSQVGGGTAGVPMSLFFPVLPWSGPGNAAVNIGSKFTDILQVRASCLPDPSRCRFRRWPKERLRLPLALQASSWPTRI